MLPTREQIERAAYDRWIRRHRAHGYDRHDWLGAENELTYLLNYQTAAMYALDSSGRADQGRPDRVPVLRADAAAREAFRWRGLSCRVLAGTTLSSAQICDECQEDCRDPLATHLRELLEDGPRPAAMFI